MLQALDGHGCGDDLDALEALQVEEVRITRDDQIGADRKCTSPFIRGHCTVLDAACSVGPIEDWVRLRTLRGKQANCDINSAVVPKLDAIALTPALREHHYFGWLIPPRSERPGRVC
jgi:hypothetical protein